MCMHIYYNMHVHVCIYIYIRIYIHTCPVHIKPLTLSLLRKPGNSSTTIAVSASSVRILGF